MPRGTIIEDFASRLVKKKAEEQIRQQMESFAQDKVLRAKVQADMDEFEKLYNKAPPDATPPNKAPVVEELSPLPGAAPMRRSDMEKADDYLLAPFDDHGMQEDLDAIHRQDVEDQIRIRTALSTPEGMKLPQEIRDVAMKEDLYYHDGNFYLDRDHQHRVSHRLLDAKIRTLAKALSHPQNAGRELDWIKQDMLGYIALRSYIKPTLSDQLPEELINAFGRMRIKLQEDGSLLMIPPGHEGHGVGIPYDLKASDFNLKAYRKDMFDLRRQAEEHPDEVSIPVMQAVRRRLDDAELIHKYVKGEIKPEPPHPTPSQPQQAKDKGPGSRHRMLEQMRKDREEANAKQHMTAEERLKEAQANKQRELAHKRVEERVSAFEEGLKKEYAIFGIDPERNPRAAEIIRENYRKRLAQDTPEWETNPDVLAAKKEARKQWANRFKVQVPVEAEVLPVDKEMLDNFSRSLGLKDFDSIDNLSKLSERDRDTVENDLAEKLLALQTRNADENGNLTFTNEEFAALNKVVDKVNEVLGYTKETPSQPQQAREFSKGKIQGRKPGYLSSQFMKAEEELTSNLMGVELTDTAGTPASEMTLEDILSGSRDIRNSRFPLEDLPIPYSWLEKDMWDLNETILDNTGLDPVAAIWNRHGGGDPANMDKNSRAYRALENASRGVMSGKIRVLSEALVADPLSINIHDIIFAGYYHPTTNPEARVRLAANGDDRVFEGGVISSLREANRLWNEFVKQVPDAEKYTHKFNTNAIFLGYRFENREMMEDYREIVKARLKDLRDESDVPYKEDPEALKLFHAGLISHQEYLEKIAPRAVGALTGATKNELNEKIIFDQLLLDDLDDNIRVLSEGQHSGYY